MMISDLIQDLREFMQDRGNMEVICNDNTPTLTFYDEEDDGPFLVIE